MTRKEDTFLESNLFTSNLFSLQNVVRVAAWISFWINFIWMMDSVVKSVKFLSPVMESGSKDNEILSSEKTDRQPHNETLHLPNSLSGIVSVINATINFLGAFFIGWILEYNQRTGWNNRLRSNISKSKLVMMIWGVLEVLLIISCILYVRAVHGFQPLSLLALLRLFFVAVAGLKLRQLHLMEKRMALRSILANHFII